MRKVVNVNGRNIYVYRKGHENKHLGRAFVKYWKEGKVALPPNGKHRLQEDRHGKQRVFANSALDRRKLPYKTLGLQRSNHRKNYVEIRHTLKELLPHIFEPQSILQHVTITNEAYAAKYKLRKDKIHVPKMGLGSVDKLYRKLRSRGITRKEVETFLKKQQVHQEHLQQRKPSYYPIYLPS